MCGIPQHPDDISDISTIWEKLGNLNFSSECKASGIVSQVLKLVQDSKRRSKRDDALPPGSISGVDLAEVAAFGVPDLQLSTASLVYVGASETVDTATTLGPTPGLALAASSGQLLAPVVDFPGYTNEDIRLAQEEDMKTVIPTDGLDMDLTVLEKIIAKRKEYSKYGDSPLIRQVKVILIVDRLL